MHLKNQLDTTNHRIWKDKNIKPETKIIFNILYSNRSTRCKITSLSIGRFQKLYNIKNVGLRKHLKVLEKNKYITYNEYSNGLYDYTIC